MIVKDDANNVLVINNINNPEIASKIPEFEKEQFITKKYYLSKENISIYLIKTKSIDSIIQTYKTKNLPILTLKEYKSTITTSTKI